MIEPNAITPDINRDLEAQRSLSDYLVGRIIESSSILNPTGVGDTAAFSYASAIYDETQSKIEKLAGGGETRLKATGSGLRAYLEQLGQEEDRQERSSFNVFREQAAALLADRLDGAPDGVIPMGYVMASQLLRHDCEVSGQNGYTHEPMPAIVTGHPPAMYALFFNIEAVDLARGAFGDKFADEVQSIYRELNNKVQTEAEAEEEVALFGGGRNTLGSVEEASGAYEAAGRWWAHAVLRGSFDNGDESDLGLSGKVMAHAGADSGIPGIEDKIGGFAKALEHLLQKHDLDSVAVDYHPDMVLREAAELSGMPYNEMVTFPWKTHMWIEDGAVRVSAGYAKPAEQIWPPAEQPS